MPNASSRGAQTRAQMAQKPTTRLRYSVSLVTQGKHRFYTLTMPSDVLGRTCFVTTRFDDPEEGFQRLLDEKRAREIADYVDSGFGTIPNSIVLSAQPEADLKVIGRGKTLEFNDGQKSFLVLDGQHRVYGFSLAKTALRVPVVIYNNLQRAEETRLFIDINTKQRPVPNELLLDIKRLAEYESDDEQLMGDVFDLFYEEPSSPLVGLLSKSDKAAKKLSRVTFYAGLKPLLSSFLGRSAEDIFGALGPYLRAVTVLCEKKKAKDCIVVPVIFRSFMFLFADVGQRVQDKFGSKYTYENFVEILSPMFERLPAATLKSPGSAIKELHTNLVKALKPQFSL